MPNGFAHRPAELQTRPTSRREPGKAPAPVAPGAPEQLQVLLRSFGNQAVSSMLSQQAMEMEQMTAGDVARRLGPGRPLDGEPRESIEAATGADLGSVRIHEGAAADQLCRECDARALTLGTDIVIADGEYLPGTTEGERLLAHELTHVVQQGVQPAPSARQLRIGAVTDPAERDAEAVAGPVAVREGAPTSRAVPVGTVQRVPRPLPAGAPIFELNIDPEPIIWELILLSISNSDTGVVDWRTHSLSREIRQICGSNYFRGSNYWKSDWEDDEFNDIFFLGITDVDIMVEMTLMVDNLRPLTSGEGEFTSGGETEVRTKKSEETTISGEVSGKIGAEKGPGAEAKLGAERKTGREREISVSGSGEVTMKMGANVYIADAYIAVVLNYNPTFRSKGRLGPRLARVGTLTFGAPAATPAATGGK